MISFSSSNFPDFQQQLCEELRGELGKSLCVFQGVTLITPGSVEDKSGSNHLIWDLSGKDNPREQIGFDRDGTTKIYQLSDSCLNVLLYLMKGEEELQKNYGSFIEFTDKSRDIRREQMRL